MIDSPYHRHIFDLCDYVKYHKEWKRETGKEDKKYFPVSTYEDVVWTSMCVVILSRHDLRDHAIVQRRHGTDNCEKLFCISRGKNSGNTAKGTNQTLASANCALAFNLWGSRKANCSRETLFYSSEILGCCKNKRVKLASK